MEQTIADTGATETTWYRRTTSPAVNMKRSTRSAAVRDTHSFPLLAMHGIICVYRFIVKS